jgi:hypothetical protein
MSDRLLHIKQKMYHLKNIVLSWKTKVPKKLISTLPILNKLPEALAWLLELLLIMAALYFLLTIKESGTVHVLLRLSVIAALIAVAWLLNAFMHWRWLYEQNLTFFFFRQK